MTVKINTTCAIPLAAAKLSILVIVLASFLVPCLGADKSTTPIRRVPRPSALKTVQLPEAKTTGAVSFEQALSLQQSAKPPANQRLKFEEIGQLAWAGRGVVKLPTVAGVTSPADETYPIKLYFAIPEGIYLYNANDHTLQQVANSDVRGELASAVLNQPTAPAPGCAVILTGSIRGLTTRSGTDVRKTMLMQAGQTAQNILLQAVSLQLGFTAINDFDISTVRRICKTARSIEPLYVIFVSYPVGQEPATATKEQSASTAKKAVLIVPRVFRDEELIETKRILELASVQTIVAGTKTGPIMGMLGSTVQVNVPLQQVKVDEFDAVVFIGGTGAVEYFNSPFALNIAREAAAKGKVLAAISIAPAILANAGVLKGVRATSYITERDRLMASGAIYTGAPVERDGFIITATDLLAVPVFARAILDALSGK